jgi:hypothetical protein
VFDPMVLEFARQLQQTSSINGAHRPLQQRTILVEMGDSTQPLGTLALLGGADIPKDRPIDGVDQLDFLLGKQENSNREGFPAYVADRLSAVKWRNWKMHLICQVNMYDPPVTLPEPKVINLLTDLKEERDVGAKNSWVGVPMTKIIIDLERSLKKYPPIKAGTPEPYIPSG